MRASCLHWQTSDTEIQVHLPLENGCCRNHGGENLIVPSGHFQVDVENYYPLLKAHALVDLHSYHCFYSHTHAVRGDRMGIRDQVHDLLLNEVHAGYKNELDHMVVHKLEEDHLQLHPPYIAAFGYMVVCHIQLQTVCRNSFY